MDCAVTKTVPKSVSRQYNTLNPGTKQNAASKAGRSCMLHSCLIAIAPRIKWQAAVTRRVAHYVAPSLNLANPTCSIACNSLNFGANAAAQFRSGDGHHSSKSD